MRRNLPWHTPEYAPRPDEPQDLEPSRQQHRIHWQNPRPPHTAAPAALVFECGTSKPASGPAKTRLNGGCGERNWLAPSRRFRVRPPVRFLSYQAVKRRSTLEVMRETASSTGSAHG